MIMKHSEEIYTSRLRDVLKKLEDNDMDVIDISISGRDRNLSNTYIIYKCRKCGSESKPATILYLSRRICRCPNQCHNLKWNYTTCYEVACQCNSSTEFRMRFGGAYSAAWENGWLEDYIWFKRPTPKPSKWNYQTTYEEATKYNSRFSFSKGSSGAYHIAKMNNWLDDYTWFKKSYQDVQHSDIINKINKRIENFPDIYFDESEFAYYRAGRNMKITLHCKNHPTEVIIRDLRGFLYGRVPNISYCKRCVDNEKLKYADFDEMIQELKKYKTLNEARKNDVCLIDHLCRTEDGKRYVDMLDRANSAWKRGIYSYEFNLLGEKYIYVGLTCNFEKRDKDHRHKKNSSVYDFSVRYNVDIPNMKKETDYIDWDIARVKESEYMDMYQMMGYNLINVRPGGGLGNVNFKNTYTLEMAIEDVRKNKYKNINDISHRNWSLYNQIVRHINDGDEGWKKLLPESKRKKPNYWTRERIKDTFLRFESVADMRKNGYGSAYMVYKQKYRNDEELNKIVLEKFKRIIRMDSKRVGMFDDLGNLIGEFSSIYEVNSKLIGFSTLLRALSQNKKSRGYYWRYIEP